MSNFKKRGIVMDPKTKSYFERSVIKYSKGDIQALLKSELPCAGPLLVTTLNGIDNLGGMCYGFRTGNVGERSTKFLHEKMGVPEALAEFLYKSARCGLVHQGMPKMGLEFFVQYDGSNKDEIFYEQPGKYIILDVTELADRYLKAIDKIAAEPEKHIDHRPQYAKQEKSALEALFGDAKTEIGGTQIYTRRQYQDDEDARRAAGQSSAAYTGQMQYWIDLPTYDE